jgi:hypothetical protein
LRSLNGGNQYELSIHPRHHRLAASVHVLSCVFSYDPTAGVEDAEVAAEHRGIFTPDQSIDNEWQ